MRWRSFVVCMVMVITQVEAANAESLRAALAAAYNHNPSLNAQRAATRAVDEGLPQAKSADRPTVTGDTDFGVTVNRSNVSGRTSNNPFGFGITINQNLFNGFQTRNRIEQSEAAIRGSREQLRNVEQTILQSAAQAYVDVLEAREVVEIRRKDISFLKEQLRSSQARLDVGEGTRTDVAQSRARLGTAQATLAVAQSTLQTSEAVYFEIIGRRPTRLNWPTGPVRLYAKSLQSGLAVAANEHPAIRATKHAVDAAAFNVKAVEGQYLPSVNLRGSASQRYNSGSRGVNTSSASATVNVTVPIYQGGLTSSQVREAKEFLAQNRILVDEARDQIRSAVVSAWSSLVAARANVIAIEGTLRAARLALAGVIEERNVGQRTQLDVLDEQSVVLDAEVALVDARSARITAGYALVAAIGRLNSKTLGLNVRHYEPKEHYRAVKDLWFGLRTPSGR